MKSALNCFVSLIILVICFVYVPTPVLSQKGEKGKDPLDDLVSQDMAIRQNAAIKENDARKARIASLLKIAAAEEKTIGFFGARTLAIELLGEYRALEAVDVMVENISFRDGGLSQGRHPLEGYSCAITLTKIGSPALPGIFKRMAKPCTELEIALFAKMIYFIEEKEIGLLRLQIGAKQAEKIGTVDGKTTRENFQKTIDEFKKFTKDRPG